MIKTFGIFWERDRICWGGKGKGNQGHLRGYESWNWTRNAAVGVRDFRYQAAVYVLYEGRDPATQRVIYVGQTRKLFSRLRHHHRGQLWNRWQRFSWFGFYDVSTKDEGGVVHVDPTKGLHADVTSALVMFEGMLIKLLEPPLNMKREQWPSATEYFQCPDSDGVELDDDEDADE